MANTVPYLVVDNAVKAIELYQNIFGAELKSRIPVTKEQGGDFGLPEDHDFENSSMHAEIDIAGAPVYMSDNFGGTKFKESNVQVLLACDSQKQIEKWYSAAEKAGCTITMKLEKQLWGAFFTSIKDPMGISWQMNYQIPEES